MRGIKKADIFFSLFLLSLFLVIMLGARSPNKTDSEKYADITVRIDGVSYFVAHNLYFEEHFLLEERYALTLIDLSEEPAYILNTDRDGVIRKIPSETKYTVTLTLRAKGAGGDSGFLLEGTRFVAPNMELVLSGETSRIVGKITHISPLFSIYNKY